MAGRRIADLVVRLWRLVEALQARRFGASLRTLTEELGTSRSSLYRHLRHLEDAGVPIAKQRVNGEMRYSLRRDGLPALGPGSSGLMALAAARQMIAPLDGTRAARELDAWMAVLGTGGATPIVSVRRARAPHPPENAAAVEAALASGRQLELLYRAASTGRTERRIVDPAAMRLDGADVYLVAWDTSRDAWRTFKLARVLEAKPTRHRVAPHPAYDEAELFGHAVRAWHGAPVEVRIRLMPDVAAIAAEYPLVAEQRIVRERNGSVVVEASVAGIVEATRWVLKWGGAAEALAPEELRAAVEAELRRAMAHYARPGVRKRREHALSRSVAK